MRERGNPKCKSCWVQIYHIRRRGARSSAQPDRAANRQTVVTRSSDLPVSVSGCKDACAASQREEAKNAVDGCTER